MNGSQDRRSTGTEASDETEATMARIDALRVQISDIGKLRLSGTLQEPKRKRPLSTMARDLADCHYKAATRATTPAQRLGELKLAASLYEAYVQKLRLYYGVATPR